MVELVVGVVESEDIIDAVAYFALNFCLAVAVKQETGMGCWLCFFSRKSRIGTRRQGMFLTVDLISWMEYVELLYFGLTLLELLPILLDELIV